MTIKQWLCVGMTGLALTGTANAQDRAWGDRQRTIEIRKERKAEAAMTRARRAETVRKEAVEQRDYLDRMGPVWAEQERLAASEARENIRLQFEAVRVQAYVRTLERIGRK